MLVITNVSQTVKVGIKLIALRDIQDLVMLKSMFFYSGPSVHRDPIRADRRVKASIRIPRVVFNFLSLFILYIYLFNRTCFTADACVVPSCFQSLNAIVTFAAACNQCVYPI
jgi:hypothetical protein